MKWDVLFLSTFNCNIWYVHFLQQLQLHIYWPSVIVFPENFNYTMSVNVYTSNLASSVKKHDCVTLTVKYTRLAFKDDTKALFCGL